MELEYELVVVYSAIMLSMLLQIIRTPISTADDLNPALPIIRKIL